MNGFKKSLGQSTNTFLRIIDFIVYISHLYSKYVYSIIDSGNSKNLSLVNKIGDKTDFTITRVNVLTYVAGLEFKVHFCNYHKVMSSNPSCLEAHAGFFRPLMKGIFDPYVL